MKSWMLAEPTVVIIPQYIIAIKTIMLYALNLYSYVCQLFIDVCHLLTHSKWTELNVNYFLIKLKK